jgi:glycosyltransferase involved in cell wall biosynthesis
VKTLVRHAAETVESVVMSTLAKQAGTNRFSSDFNRVRDMPIRDRDRSDQPPAKKALVTESNTNSTKKKICRLSVVVPVFNERENVAALDARILEAIGRLGLIDWEVLYVDDGSQDGTGPMLDTIADKNLRARIIHFETNQGQTAAMDAGIHHARGQLLITMDADLQNAPEDMALLMDHLAEDVGCVCGVRTQRRDNWLRRVSSKIANAIRNRLSNDNVTDTGCSLKLYRRECFDHIKLFEGMHRFLPTLIKMEGYRVIEVPVSHHPRTAGDSKYGVWNRVFKSFVDLLAVRWMKNRRLAYMDQKGKHVRIYPQ